MQIDFIDNFDSQSSTGSADLGDKILDAFYVAYSTGETEIATALRKILADYVNRPAAERFAAASNRTDPLRRAALWTAVVKTREEYKRLASSPAVASSEKAAVLQEVEDAYRRWARG